MRPALCHFAYRAPYGVVNRAFLTTWDTVSPVAQANRIRASRSASDTRTMMVHVRGFAGSTGLNTVEGRCFGPPLFSPRGIIGLRRASQRHQ